MKKNSDNTPAPTRACLRRADARMRSAGFRTLYARAGDERREGSGRWSGTCLHGSPRPNVRFTDGAAFYSNSVCPGKPMIQRPTDSTHAGIPAAISHSRQDDPPEGQLGVRKWYFLASRLPGQLAVKSVGGLSTRRFIEAVLWMAATDSTWPQLPRSYGNFHAVYQRFARWARLDVWDYVITCLDGDPRLPALQRMVHQHLEIRRRRHKPAEQASPRQAELAANMAERILALEVQAAKRELQLRALLVAFPQIADFFPDLAREIEAGR
jgi:transposase